MKPSIGLLTAGAALVVIAVFALFAVATAYWPFQTVVQVIAPFLGISIVASVGLSLIFTAFLLPRISGVQRMSEEPASVIDSLLSEANRRR